MFEKYKSLDRLGKVFAWLTMALLLTIVVLYLKNVMYALNMDSNSYNCKQDSMMSQICADPYGSSVIWGVIDAFIFAWPLMAAWVIAGTAALVRSYARKRPIKG